MKTIYWGLIEYSQATSRQIELVADLSERVDGGLAPNEIIDDTIVFCSHKPVVTIGRGTKPGEVFGWNGSTVETSRGGRATYHGPSQIVAYPIVNLNKSRDLHGYLRALENAIVYTLKEFAINAEARTVKIEGEPSLTGVWVRGNGSDTSGNGSNVPDRKIASIGIAVKKWITYHGLALNVSHDPTAFVGINPCGFSADVMTSMEQVLGHAVDRAAVQATLAKNLEGCLRLLSLPVERMREI
jgi:lipoyl(octanoyl) transferase